MYRELRDNQSYSYAGEYYLDESNPLLNFFLKNIAIAKKVHIWKPIGDYVIEYIKKQRGPGNFYNQPNGRFSDGDESCSCPIFIGALFFNVMVSRAIFQRSKDHMWLRYCNHFVNEILESLDHAADVDKSSEFPSRFDYLLYELFSHCGAWAGAAEHLDYTDWSEADIENSPEYWAAKSFGEMLFRLMKSDKLSDLQKGYFLEIAVRRMQQLDQKGFKDRSRIIFENSVREHTAVDDAVVKVLSDIYRSHHVDHMLKSEESTFEVELAVVNQTQPDSYQS